MGGDIGAAYPFRDPVALVCNDEGKLIGLDLNRGLRDENGELYDIMAGTFLVVGLGEEDFASLSPELAQKYMEHFRQPEQFISLGGQIIALPVEPEKDNPLRTAEMTLEDDYGMIDGVINNGRRGEETEKADRGRNLPSGSGWRTQRRSVRNTSRRRRDAPAGILRSMAAYEQEQEMANGMGLLPGGERPPPV